MKPQYLEVSVRVERVHAELAESLLLGQGALAVTLTDHGDTPLWEPPVGETPLWDAIRVTGLFPLDADRVALRQTLMLMPLVEVPELTELEEQVWERAWMDRFAPMRFGEQLWIVPTGHEPPDPDATLIRLDPGLAFGTGTHATTHLCLAWLDGQDLKGQEVIDFGCGSGILAIAAALQGARSVLAIDYDPQAVTATRTNAERNELSDRIEARAGDTPAGLSADLVIANILAPILTRLAPQLVASLRPAARLIMTGVLQEQAADLIDAFAAEGLVVHIAAQRKGWVLLEGRRV